ncbi:MAG: hypothetical protein H6853_07720 [Rhodospirillales bacterium]|nr:hypothetical protein [Alphaproteobacteria bacterium]USO03407.1 MAG: hypothetical protein H6853_07720 [Rhodospirillales bacterium]
MRIKNGHVLSVFMVLGTTAAAISAQHEETLCDKFKNSKEGIDLAGAITSFEKQNPGAQVIAKIQKKGLNCSL